jgi:alcohol dehydrogenase (cytochrome c)
MTIVRARIVIVAAALLISAIGGVAWYRHSISWKSASGLESMSNDRIWRAVSCRVRLYAQKAQGGLPGVSWTELWGLTLLGAGFHCAEGSSLEASLQFSSSVNESDQNAGAQIFHERCVRCHGSEGTGGSVAPSLTRSEFDHGDSDLAIYKVLRDGIPGTAMPKADLSFRQRLQVAAYVKMLQAHRAVDQRPRASRPAIQVSSERLQAAGSKTDEWLTYSGSYSGWRYSPLTDISPANVGQLRIRWVRQFDINRANIEATPLVTDGEIFMVPEAGHVLALNAKTGDVIWVYKRPIPDDLPLEYGPVNRGLAVYGSTLFLGNIDGNLVALDASNGNVLWQTLVASPSDGYSMTGAPLVVGHSVIVGISGGEFGIRGFLAAYDVSTGERQWKFDTIPGPGEVGHETWKNDAWQTGGGATWITGSYDPSTDLLYWGVGNPSPAFAGDLRPGDNLFTASVVALHASTGKLAWYFQFTPHDEHDRDAAQTPVLADLAINGAVRKVICWPNRNGFYYVLDRVTGMFLAAEPFVGVDWAAGLTPDGRPILANVATISTAGRSARPGITGGTNWQNPAFDPSRKSIFIPAVESSTVFTQLPPGQTADRRPNEVFIGSGWSQVASGTHEVVALEAATGRLHWKYLAPPNTGSDGDLNFSGLLATGGGLVFGASGGIIFALDADSGREVWRLPLGGTTKAAPISFTVDGQQLIALAAGRALFVFGR